MAPCQNPGRQRDAAQLATIPIAHLATIRRERDAVVGVQCTVAAFEPPGHLEVEHHERGVDPDRQPLAQACCRADSPPGEAIDDESAGRHVAQDRGVDDVDPIDHGTLVAAHETAEPFDIAQLRHSALLGDGATCDARHAVGWSGDDEDLCGDRHASDVPETPTPETDVGAVGLHAAGRPNFGYSLSTIVTYVQIRYW